MVCALTRHSVGLTKILALLQVDIWGLKYMFMPLKWIGMNAMVVYVMAAEGIFAGFINGWYYEDPHNTLVGFFRFLTCIFLLVPF